MASAIQRVQGRNGTFWTRLRKAFADAKAAEGQLAASTATRERSMPPPTSRNMGQGARAGRLGATGKLRRAGRGAGREAKGPDLAALLAEIYGDGPWRYVKTTARKADGTPLRPQEELDHLAGLRHAAIPLSGLQREQLAAGHRAKGDKGRSSRRAVTLFPAVPNFPGCRAAKLAETPAREQRVASPLLPTQSLN